MIPVLLLAKSFVRQNRWLLLAFVGFPFLLGAFLWSPNHPASPQDLTEIVQQEMFYGVLVITFLASSAIHNEKRSRRIIGVLSKDVSRERYLFALLLGSAGFAVVYFASVGVAMLWLSGVSKTATNTAATLLVRGTVAALWAASLGLFFSTFLHSFFAGAVATALTFAPLAFGGINTFFVPVAGLLKGSDRLPQKIPLAVTLSALGEFALILFVAAQVFMRRDVTVSIE